MTNNELLSRLEMSLEQFADEIRVSRPTVERWSRGTSLPHPAMRHVIIHVLRKKVHPGYTS